MAAATDAQIATARVDAAIAHLASVISPVGGRASAELLGPVGAIASRGKRMRAGLLIASHTACGGGAVDAAWGVATALELFQTAALIHDDVLDRSDSRRGMPSTHKAMEGSHQAAGLLGDGALFGINGAILAGDLTLMASTRELATALAGAPTAVAREVSDRFAAMASLCTAGQYLDMRLAQTSVNEVTAADVIAVMRAKTASYTTEGPLALGAALAAKDRDSVDAWAAAGVPLGIAFQLRDDVLGAIGDSAVTGKPAGDDLREGKRTLLVVHALECATSAQRATLSEVLGAADASDQAIAAATTVLRETGAVESVEQNIHAHATEALHRLAELGIDDVLLRPIHDLVDAAVSRTA